MDGQQLTLTVWCEKTATVLFVSPWKFGGLDSVSMRGREG
jgi:hypothetical protein